MAKKEKSEKQQRQQVEAKPAQAQHSAKERPRLRVRYEKEIAPALLKELEMTNAMAVPRLHKIVVNMGVGEATQNAKILDQAGMKALARKQFEELQRLDPENAEAKKQLKRRWPF